MFAARRVKASKAFVYLIQGDIFYSGEWRYYDSDTSKAEFTRTSTYSIGMSVHAAATAVVHFRRTSTLRFRQRKSPNTVAPKD